MLLDDGGDPTLLIHKGVEFERSGRGPGPRRAAPQTRRRSSSP